jgi:hypothetical protein
LATKISITKKLEAELRGLREQALEAGDDFALECLRPVLELIDAAHSACSSKASGSGCEVDAGGLVNAIAQHRALILPPTGPISRSTYARLTKALRYNGVTLEQANALGIWLAGPGMKAAPGEITIDRIIKNLGDWITRAVANKPEYQRPEW